MVLLHSWSHQRTLAIGATLYSSENICYNKPSKPLDLLCVLAIFQESYYDYLFIHFRISQTVWLVCWPVCLRWIIHSELVRRKFCFLFLNIIWLPNARKQSFRVIVDTVGFGGCVFCISFITFKYDMQQWLHKHIGNLLVLYYMIKQVWLFCFTQRDVS